MPSMQDIQSEISNLLGAVEDMDPEVFEANMPALESYANELASQEASKVDGIAYAMRKAQADIDFLKSEEGRIHSRRIAREKAMDRFREYMTKVFLDHGLQKVKGTTSTAFIRQTEAVIVSDAQALPEELVTMKVEYAPDKAAIKAAIKGGRDVPGAELRTNHNINFR